MKKDKKVAEIYQESDYSRFISYDYQREKDIKHVQNLANEMICFGSFTHDYPVIVRKEGSKLRILNGHHRFYAAQMAGMPVVFKYVDSGRDEVKVMLTDNQNQRKWLGKDIINYWAQKGKSDYKKLQEYIARGLPIPYAANALAGYSASQDMNKVKPKLDIGEFKVKETRYADEILYIIDSTKQRAKHITKRAYIEAIASVLRIDGFNSDTLIDRINKNPDFIVPCSRRDQALVKLDNAYNHRTRDKIPLELEARKALQERKRYAFEKSSKRKKKSKK